MEKIFLGLLIAKVAFSISMFLNASKVSEGDLYIHTSIDEFTPSGTSLYVTTNCDASGGVYRCAYRVTAAGALFVNGRFNQAQATLYLNETPLPYIVAQIGSGNGIYVPD